MQEVKLELNEHRQGAFKLMDGEDKAGEMDIAISGSELRVFHTEVLPEWEGQGLSKKLLEAMVSYAREHQLKVYPLCMYVLTQFKRHPDEYADIWKKAAE